MASLRRNWKLGLGVLVGVVIGALATELGTSRIAAADSDDNGKGRPVSLAIFKDPNDINSRAYGYVLYDSGKVDRKPLQALAGN